MNIFGVLTMAGGLALFLYGMNVMGDSLAKLSGGNIKLKRGIDFEKRKERKEREEGRSE